MIAHGFYEELVIAGFGGQGVLLAGKLTAQTAMVNEHQVTYMPSYGAEVRGGTANCMIVISDEPIASPIISHPTSLIALNKASMDKFAPRLQSGGLLILNRSLIDERPSRSDIEILEIPADEIAMELQSPKSTNMVALGAYLQRRGLISPDVAVGALAAVLPRRHHDTIPVNMQALQRGSAWAMQHE